MNGTSKIEFNTSEKKLADIAQEPKNSYYHSRYKSGGLYFNTTFQFDSFPFDDYLKLNLVGLSYEYQLYPSGVQALNKLIQNYDQHFQLDYMKHTFDNDISQSMVDFVNGNYLPSLCQLYEHFEKTDVSKALKYKKLAFEIAKKSNQLNEVQALMGKE